MHSVFSIWAFEFVGTISGMKEEYGRRGDFGYGRRGDTFDGTLDVSFDFIKFIDRMTTGKMEKKK